MLIAPSRPLAAVALLILATVVEGQDGGARPAPTPVPFGVGERAEYRVTLGLFGSVGVGTMEVLGVEDVRGRQTYHLRFTVEGGVLFARVDDDLQSWMDVDRLFSRRFLQKQSEVAYRRHRRYEFFPDERRWESVTFRAERDTVRDSGELAHTDEPLDDVSFLYDVRTLPLEVGKTYTFDRYFKESGNPVQLNVLRRDTVTVDAGTFPVIVVQPIIQTRGLFGEGGRAEVYVSDDARRLVVQLKSSVPVIGKLSLYLRSYEPGARLVQPPLGERIPPE